MLTKSSIKWALQAFLLILITSFTFASAVAENTAYYVDLAGSDAAAGTSAQAPLLTIQHALELAQPGDVIYLAAGTYRQDAVTVRGGTASAPIVITGPADAVLVGGGNGRIFEINHDYITLNGFTLNGLHGDPNNKEDYRDKLLYVHGQETRRGPMGLRVLNMTLANAGGECLRFRYFVQDSEIAYSKFFNCGVADFVFAKGGKNGEAIYIGTSSEQWHDGKNPTADPDESNNNWIHHNFMNTQGNECVEVKEGASHNIIEYNECTGQKDPNSGGFGARGSGNTFRFNESYGNKGAGVRLGGHRVDNVQYGEGNHIYQNEIHDNQAGGVKFQVQPQGDVCDNVMFNNNGGDNVGKYGAEFDATAVCSADEPPIASSPTPPSATEPPELPPVTVSASSHDGNLPENTLDYHLDTRWSAQGNGEWIKYDLGSNQFIHGIGLAFHKGNQRIAYFELEVSVDNSSWMRTLSGESNGLSNELQTFEFAETQARYVRFVGYGNTVNHWNSLTEVRFLVEQPPSDGPMPNPTSQPTAVPTATPPLDPSEPTPTPVFAVTAVNEAVYQLQTGDNWLEAEHMTNVNTGKWTLAENKTASNGRYMHLDTDRNSRGNPVDVLEYTFNLDYQGNLFVWYRGIRSPHSRHGIYLQLDDGPVVRGELSEREWTWHLDNNTDDEWVITSGRHTLRIYNRFEQSSLDKLFITTNPFAIPQGQGEPSLPRP